MRPEHFVRLSLFFLPLAVYAQAVSFDYVSLDDPVYVQLNEKVTNGLSWEGVEWAFQTGEQANWHPLTWISLMVDGSFSGDKPTAYHLTNVLLHCCNTVLLFSVLLRMTGDLWPSALVAALFGVHPHHVESVAWITERKDTLSQFFGLWALWCYARYQEKRTDGWLVLTAVPYVLSLMAKQTLVTLPFLLLLFDIWPYRRWELPGMPVPDEAEMTSPRRREKLLDLLVEKFPFLIIAVVFCVIVIRAQGQVGAMATLEQVPPAVRVGNALVSYADYLKRMFWPLHLCVFYPRAHEGEPLSRVLASGALLLTITAFCVWQLRRRPFLFVGWCWFIGTLVPMIGILQVGDQASADRYMYFPAIGIYVMLAWGGASLVSSAWLPRATLATAASALVLTLALLAWRQAQYWANSPLLYSHALELRPDNYFVQHAIGIYYVNQKRNVEAAEYFKESLRLMPDYVRALVDLSLVEAKLKHYPEAEAAARKAIEINPESPHCYIALAQQYGAQGRYEEAVKEYKRAITVMPEMAEFHADLGRLLMRTGKNEEAVAALEKAIAFKPSMTIPRKDLCRALLRLKRYSDVGNAAAEGRALEKKNGEFLSVEALALWEAGKTHAAKALMDQALLLDPNNPEVQHDAGRLLQLAGHPERAFSCFRRAQQLDPTDEIIGMDYIRPQMASGNWPEVANASRRILEENPRSLPALESLVVALVEQGRDAESLETLAKAGKLPVNSAELDRLHAWILATSATPSLRNPSEALRLATAARKKGDADPRLLDTLAAAQAANQQFALAARSASEALEAARALGRAPLAQAIASRKSLYEKGQSYLRAPTNPAGVPPRPANATGAASKITG